MAQTKDPWRLLKWQTVLACGCVIPGEPAEVSAKAFYQYLKPNLPVNEECAQHGCQPVVARDAVEV